MTLMMIGELVIRLLEAWANILTKVQQNPAIRVFLPKHACCPLPKLRHFTFTYVDPKTRKKTIVPQSVQEVNAGNKEVLLSDADANDQPGDWGSSSSNLGETQVDNINVEAEVISKTRISNSTVATPTRKVTRKRRRIEELLLSSKKFLRGTRGKRNRRKTNYKG